MEGIDTKQWQIHLNALHPSSQLKYNKCIKQFIEFIDEQNLSLHPERIIDNVIYFASYLRKDVELAAATIWSFISIVSTFLTLTMNLQQPPISNTRVKKLLTQYQKSEPQAAIFTKEEVHNFLNLSTSQDQHKRILLQMQVVMVIAIWGVLRVSELIGLTFNDIAFEGNIMKVSLYRKKSA